MIRFQWKFILNFHGHAFMKKINSSISGSGCIGSSLLLVDFLWIVLILGINIVVFIQFSDNIKLEYI